MQSAIVERSRHERNDGGKNRRIREGNFLETRWFSSVGARLIMILSDYVSTWSVMWEDADRQDANQNPWIITASPKRLPLNLYVATPKQEQQLLKYLWDTGLIYRDRKGASSQSDSTKLQTKNLLFVCGNYVNLLWIDWLMSSP